MSDAITETNRLAQRFTIKDSGERREFASGMVRDTTEGKRDYLLVRDGPMYERWAEHLTKGALKYAKRNWMQAAGEEEYERFRESALRHFEAWLRGDRDEDHGAAVFFNINGAEYVLARIVEWALDEPVVPDLQGRDFAIPLGSQVGSAGCSC